MASNFCRSNKSLLRDSGQWSVILFLKIFFVSGVGFPFYPEISYISVFTMILQCIRIIVGDAGFEHGTSAPEVMCVTNEPPHLVITHKQYLCNVLYMSAVQRSCSRHEQSFVGSDLSRSWAFERLNPYLLIT